ncbi:MAG: hypothetical protein AB7N80_02645 [Bdellovibrionales bacterium]
MCKQYVKKGILILATLALAGCLQDQVSEEGTVVDLEPGSAPDPDTYVCNPLDDGVGDQARDQGLHGRLYYVEPGGPQYSSVHDYMSYATEAPVDLFFNQLYVPTRPFDRGFVTESGITLQAADGSTLYEWFGIHFESQLQLASGQAPGRYQIGVLSDDGTMMSVGEPGFEQLLINNDGWTPTRMRCATEAVELAAGQKLPFTLDYFQGPRYHIALVMVWRPWPASPADVNDPLCDRSGNSFWFDSTQNPPRPTSNYHALLSRGWQVIQPENFALPGSQEENPCNEPAPILSNLAIGDITTTSATVTWLTDRPATTQVVLTEVATGTVTVLDGDAALVLNHTLVMTGLRVNTQYRVKAVSKSASGRSSETPEITFRTSR